MQASLSSWWVTCTAATPPKRCLDLSNLLTNPLHYCPLEIFLQSMDSKTWEGSRCRHHVDFSKWAKKRPAIHPLARPKTRSFCTFRNLSFDRSTTEDKPLYLTSFTGKKSSQSQGKGHCQLLPKDWKTASHALTGDPLAPQQPRVAMGRHYAYAPLATAPNAIYCPMFSCTGAEFSENFVKFYEGQKSCKNRKVLAGFKFTHNKHVFWT